MLLSLSTVTSCALRPHLHDANNMMWVVFGKKKRAQSQVISWENGDLAEVLLYDLKRTCKVSCKSRCYFALL
jgi:hypothetical protein